MRIKTAAIFLIILGVVLAAGLLINDRTMAPAQLEKMRTVCLSCHSEVPKYATASSLHIKMASFNCRRCHDAVSSLTVTDNIHRGLKWLSIGGVLFALAGFIVSLTVINRKGKAA